MNLLPSTTNLLGRSSGFTLMEILFALALFGLCSSALFPAFIEHIRFNNFSEVRSASYAAAQVVLDELRLQDPALMPESGTLDPVAVPIGSRTFSVTVSYCEDETYCAAETRHLTVRVAYRNEQIYEVETVYTRLR